MSIAEKLTTIAENQQKVFDSGYKKGTGDFWDTVQANGTRTDYNMGFSSRGWTKDTFKPKYNISPRSAERMFYQFNYQSPKFDFVEHLNQLGVELDFSGMTYNTWSYTFGYMNVSRLGVLDLRGIKALQSTFYNCPVERIDKLIVNENNTYSNTFNMASSLTDITIEGIIGQNGFNVQWATNLTPVSLRSIIDALKDYSEDTSGTRWTLTIGTTNYDKLPTEDIEKAERKGWTLA